VYSAQIDLTEVGETHSVELALAAFGARLDQAYTGVAASRLHAYEEVTHAEGLGLVGSLLIGHARSGLRPYWVAGIGVGPLWVEWRKVSPTDDGLGTRLVVDGSFREESVVKLGSMLQVGIGLRLRQRFDLRAQGQALVVPSTNAREDLKFMPAVTLSAGLSLL
jgi:hypothetical protein